MSDLGGQIGEVRFTLEVKRKETGKVETFEMVASAAAQISFAAEKLSKPKKVVRDADGKIMGVE